jgi:hypothetical protein
VSGIERHLDLGLVGAGVAPGGKTVSGTETSVWPLVAGVGVAVALLTLLNVARKVLLLLGVLVVAAGGGLLYYVLNVVEIETAGRNAVEHAVAGAAITGTTGAGPPLLLASGIAIVLGALISR